MLTGKTKTAAFIGLRDHQSQWPCAFARSHHFFGPQPRKACSTVCSIGSVRSAEYVDHSTQTPQRLLYIASHVNYCNTVLAGAPRTITDRFHGCSTRLHEWSVEPGSSITACPNWFTPSYTGWTFHNVSSINWESQFIGVCRIRLLSNRWTTVCTCGVGSSAGSTHFPHPSSLPFHPFPTFPLPKLYCWKLRNSPWPFVSL